MKTVTHSTVGQIHAKIVEFVKAEIAGKTPLGEEIDYYLGVQTENEDYSGVPDYVDACFQAERFSEENADRTMLRAVRKLLIAANRYRVMSQEEIDSTVVSRGTKWAFKLDGVAYTLDFSDWEIGQAAY